MNNLPTLNNGGFLFLLILLGVMFLIWWLEGYDKTK